MNRPRQTGWIFLVVLVGLAIGGCTAAPPPTPLIKRETVLVPQTALATQVVVILETVPAPMTVIVRQTVLVSPTPLPAATGTLTPTATTLPTATATRTATAPPTATATAQGTTPSATSSSSKIDLTAFMPPGPERDLVLGSCTSCHSYVCPIIGQRSVDHWQTVKASHRDRVGTMSDADYDALFNYLSENFNDQKPAPVLPPELANQGCAE